MNKSKIDQSKWLSEGAIEQVIEERLAQFEHQPPVLIRDTEGDVPGIRHSSGDLTAGSNFGGRVYLFRDSLQDLPEVDRVLWHELHHYGLRRFMSKDQYIFVMQNLYARDSWIRAHTDAWLSSDEAAPVLRLGFEYAKARGVDEALSKLAENNCGEHENNGFIAKTIRRVSEWMSFVADKFGFTGAAAEWRGISNTEARQLIKATFNKLAMDAAPVCDDFAFTSSPEF